jgi:radical SAM superfamily enzyme YgiQ (UPF0313 family)
MLIKPKSERKNAADFPPLERPPVQSGDLRILLVKPDVGEMSVGFTSLARVPPLDLLMVAASAARHEIHIVDNRLEDDGALEKQLTDFDPHVVGVTAYSAEAESTKEICRQIRALRPSVPIIQGGYHAAMAPEDAMNEPSVDFLVMGEAEAILTPLLDAMQAGQGFEDVQGIAYWSGDELVFTEAPMPINDLDTLPFPDWDLVGRYQHEYYLNVMGVVATVESTRGCPFDCSFCSVWVFNNRGYRKKSPERILEELNRLPQGVEVAAFVDDEFWVDAPRSLELASLLAQQPDDWRGNDWRFWAQVRTGDIARRPELVEKWSEVGMKVLLLGIESVKNSELKDLHNKRSNIEQAVTALETMKQFGIEAWGCFIVNPEWVEEDFIELESFVREHEIAFPQYTVLTPLPGTPLTDGLIETGQLVPENLKSQLLDFLHASTATTLPLNKFYERMASLYRTTGVRSSASLYRRMVRNGVLSREWLQTDMGRRVRAFFEDLCKVDTYTYAHRLLGEDLNADPDTTGL